MNHDPQPCPKCGAAIPDGSPQGLCPKCLMAAAAAATNDTGLPTGERPVPPTREEVATAFPHLEVLELIGQGGMGAVFKVRQPKLDRLVALKILTRSRAADAAFAERFTREGRVLARLNHPGIVSVHDFGQAEGFFYLLMEFVDGVNLRQAMRAGRFTPAEALAVVPKICEALQFAHNEGILHRDIKPENILLDSKGRVKIADFGIAKLVGEPDTAGPITESGTRLGTPHYMAPEQIEKPSEVDHRADIYSLGVVFYEMLTGELPIGRFSPPSERSASDPRLDEVVFRTLEKEPSRRPQSANEVKTQVESISGSPAARPPIPGSSSSAWKKLITFQVLGSIAIAAITAWCWRFKITEAHHTPLLGTSIAEQPIARPSKVLKAFTPADHTISKDVTVDESGAWLVNSSQPQVFRLFEAPDPGVDDCVVIYKAMLKTEGLAGGAYLEMWCRFPALGEAFSRGLDKVITGSNDWASYQIPFFLKKGEKPDLIKLNVSVQGAGRVWIKDVELSAVFPAAPQASSLAADPSQLDARK